MSSAIENRPFVCSICTTRFKNKQFLQRHMISHTSLRNFLCEMCGKSYKYKKGLNRHIQKIHSEIWESMRVQQPRKRCQTFDVSQFLSLDDSPYRPNESLENKVFKEKSINESVSLKESTCRIIFTSPYPANSNF